MTGHHDPDGIRRPEVYFLPLALRDRVAMAALGLPAEVLVRRIPDFVHQILNACDDDVSGLLEIQTPPDEGPTDWVTLEEPPEPEDAFAMAGDEPLLRAVVTGTLGVVGDPGAENTALDLTFLVSFTEDRPTGLPSTVRARLDPTDPVPALVRAARKVAALLGVDWHEPPAALMTGSGAAFCKFLEGLDGAAALIGGMPAKVEGDRAGLLAPFVDALALDPRFGLALRTAHMSIRQALDGRRVGQAAFLRLLDRVRRTAPADGDACVAVAEHLGELGDDERARAWLQHAVALDPPPPRALEKLGVLLANDADVTGARNLWRRGLETDGHPDFLAHLARLAFLEGDDLEAWDLVLRGLRRLLERQARAAEWFEPGGHPLLLHYLVEHLREADVLDHEVREALTDLVGVFVDPTDRAMLGLCLAAIDAEGVARSELTAALRLGRAADDEALDEDLVDRAERALLELEVPDFERRFARAIDTVISGKEPLDAVPELQRFLDVRPDFWPCRFFLAVALARSGEEVRALDMMAEVLRLRPDQPDVLDEMGVLFDRRGNPKRALECIDRALATTPHEARRHARRARYLDRLGRRREAREAAARALELEPRSAEYRALHRRLEADDEA